MVVGWLRFYAAVCCVLRVALLQAAVVGVLLLLLIFLLSVCGMGSRGRVSLKTRGWALGAER